MCPFDLFAAYAPHMVTICSEGLCKILLSSSSREVISSFVILLLNAERIDFCVTRGRVHCHRQSIEAIARSCCGVRDAKLALETQWVTLSKRRDSSCVSIMIPSDSPLPSVPTCRVDRSSKPNSAKRAASSSICCTLSTHLQLPACLAFREDARACVA